MATTQQYGLGPQAFPRGWFMIGEDRELGKLPLSLRFFGRDLVLYRGANGPVLLDAYCPHMRTHLGKNTTSFIVQDGNQIEGDSIRCPYHGWRFGADGKCNDIPYYSGTIPSSATIRSWPVRVRMGCLFIWHDAVGGVPEYEPPELNEWEDPAWVRWELDHLGTLPTHPVEIVDNMADIRHFDSLHGSKTAYFRVEYEGHRYLQFQGGGHRTLTPTDVMLETVTHYDGPGILTSRQYGTNQAIQFVCHTPVEDGKVQVWHGVLYKSAAAIAGPSDLESARAHQRVACTAFTQDFEIWGNKEPALNIMAVPTDGPFAKGRLWYSQFYGPRSAAEAIHKRIGSSAHCQGLSQSSPRSTTG